jgi:DNA (cytosine-5)-methyltransferase 1
MAGLQPRAFVMENVSGMVKGKMRLIFADILRELRAPGYRVRACLLNSKWFDVPQSRPRLIFIGVRHDLDVDPTFPAARAYPISLAASLADPYEHRFHGSISEATVQRWVETRRGANHDVRFNMYRARWNRPVNTITRTVGDVGQFHPDEPRLLSLGELMRCASYPDQFQFAHGFNPSVAGIGNSVPPLFMRAIASHVRSSVLEAVPVP